MSLPLRKGEAGQQGNAGQFAKSRLASADDSVGFGTGPPGSAGHSPSVSGAQRLEESRRTASRLSTVITGGHQQLGTAARDRHPLIRAQATTVAGTNEGVSDPDAERVLSFVRR